MGKMEEELPSPPLVKEDFVAEEEPPSPVSSSQPTVAQIPLDTTANPTMVEQMPRTDEGKDTPVAEVPHIAVFEVGQ